MKIGEIIMAYLEEKDLSQRQFATLCGLSNGYESMLENNCNPQTGEPLTPSLAMLKKIAVTMYRSLNDLMLPLDDMPVTLNGDSKIPDGLLPASRIRVPLIDGVAAGEPIYAPEDAEVWTAGEDVKCDFALRVKCDSMMPTFDDGNIVFIRQQDATDYEGQIGALWIGDGAALKHIYHTDGGVQLVSDNLKYPPMYFTDDDTDGAHLIGLPVGFYRGQ